MPYESSRDYIENHTDTTEIDQEKLQKSVEALSTPLGAVECAESGDARIAREPFTIEFSYGPIPEEIALSMLNGGVDEARTDPDSLRELTSWKFIHEDRGTELDLGDLLPAGYTVVFSPHKQEWSSYAKTNGSHRRIILNGPPTSPMVVLHLLHEAGHTWDVANKTSFAASQQESVHIDDLALKLLRERNAWAYALKKIKPYWSTEPAPEGVTSIQKEDVLRIANDECLHAYGISISQDMEQRKQLSQNMAHAAKDYEFEFFNVRDDEL